MGIKKITKKFKNGDIFIEEYDENGNRIKPEIIASPHIKSKSQNPSNELFNEVKKYDENGNLIYHKFSECGEIYYFYINDILVQKRYHDIINNTDSITLYDKKGNQIYKKKPGISSYINVYDYKGNIIYSHSSGENEWCMYDEDNRIKQYICLDKENNVFVELYDYFKLQSHSIGYRSDGSKFESWTEYDKNGNKIRYMDTCDKLESIWKYNEENYLVYHSDEIGNEYFYEYHED